VRPGAFVSERGSPLAGHRSVEIWLARVSSAMPQQRIA
jgi:hypothetical protein